jgi:hypothetical protein
LCIVKDDKNIECLATNDIEIKIHAVNGIDD